MSHSLSRLAQAALLALAVNGAQAQQLLHPSAPVASYSQSYLSAALVQWEYSIPAATNPLLDTTGAATASGDQGKYFFLAASGGEAPVVRNVTVRNDQILVFSPITIAYSADAVFDTEAKMRADAIKVLGTVSNLTVQVDGVDALLPAGVSSTQDFRQSGPLFPFTLVADNITGYAPGVFPGITEGFTFAMAPLSAGNHLLHFTALMNSGYGFTFAQDITYNISAVPEPSTWASMALGLLAIGAGASYRRRDTQA
jgi:hypothetical protein